MRRYQESAKIAHRHWMRGNLDAPRRSAYQSRDGHDLLNGTDNRGVVSQE